MITWIFALWRTVLLCALTHCTLCALTHCTLCALTHLILRFWSISVWVSFSCQLFLVQSGHLINLRPRQQVRWSCFFLFIRLLVNQCLGSIFMSTFSCSIRPSDALAAKTTGNMVMFFFVHKASLLGYLRSDALYCYALWRTVFYALWRTCLYLSCSNLVVSTKVH